MFDIDTADTPSAPADTFGLFQDAKEVTVCAANDYAATALALIHDLLDEAVQHGEMSGKRAWLVQQLVTAREAAISHSLRSA